MDARTKLEFDYTGVWGKKALVLGLANLAPVFLALKFHSIPLHISPATGLFIVYHGLGFYIFASVKQAKSKGMDSSGWNKLGVLARVHRGLAYPVLALLFITGLAVADFEYGGSHNIAFPEPVYAIIGVPQMSRECKRLTTQLSRHPQKAAGCTGNGGTKPRAGTIWELYLAANRASDDTRAISLMDVIGIVRDSLAANDGRRSLTFVYAEAGSGKSSFFRALRDEFGLLPPTGSSIDLPRHFQHCGSIPSVTGRKARYFALPGDPSAACFPELVHSALSGREGEWLVLDGMDEISQPAADEVIDAAATAVATSHGTRHIVLVGRPEAFANRADLRPTGVKMYFARLSLPRYNNTHDIALRRENLFQYRGNSMTPSTASVAEALQRHPWLCEDFRNLELSKELIIRSETIVRWSDEQIMKLEYDALLARNAPKNKRPSFADSEYSAALQRAASAVSPDGVDGSFSVGLEDSVAFGSDAVVTRDLLDRSGLVFRVPFDAYPARYQFSPSWLHRYLVSGRARTLHCPTASRTGRITGWVVLVALGCMIAIAGAVLLRGHRRLRGQK